MFWKRSRREERRQKVLDDLLAMDPTARRGRIDQALAAGDVHADEVDSALRLVDRLDALSVFTVRPNGAAPDRVTSVDGRPGRRKSRAAASAPTVSLTGAARAKSPRLKPLAVPIGSDPERARHWLASDAIPMDALESAKRLAARDRAARKAGAAPLSARRGRTRAELAGSPAEPLAEPVPIRGEPAPEGSRDESWPSISWLRP